MDEIWKHTIESDIKEIKDILKYKIDEFDSNEIIYNYIRSKNEFCKYSGLDKITREDIKSGIILSSMSVVIFNYIKHLEENQIDKN